jgi:hypothetical protein
MSIAQHGGGEIDCDHLGLRITPAASGSVL